MSISAALFARTASGGPWNIEPTLGISSEYNSNPLLRELEPRAEEHVAALIDFPLRYDSDTAEFMLRPNGRISNSTGYSSLASNYAHLDGSGTFTNELGAATVQAELARDSSLYYVGALVEGLGVRRDTASAEGELSRLVTERTQVLFDASWSQVRYAQPAAADFLIDYRYVSAGPTLSRSLSEIDTLKVTATLGRYQSLNGITESKSTNLQAGYVRQLSEIWTLSTTGGYSQSKNSEKYFLYGLFYLGNISSNQNGAVYSATLARRGERVSLSIGASRALQPTGFAFLSRQDSVNASAAYVLSERWDFSVTGAWLKAVSPQEIAGEAQLNTREFATRYVNMQVTANWHWTPQWAVALHATRITTQNGPPPTNSASTGVSLELSRHFLRTEL